MPKKRTLLISILIAIPLFVSVSSLNAQSIWQDYSTQQALTLEILKPVYHDREDVSFLTSVLFLSARIPVTRSVIFVAELPFSYINWDIPQGPDLGSQQTFGNPYFGLELGFRRSPLFFEAGVRAPLTADLDGDNALATHNGYVTDFVDRAEAFAPDAIPISGFLNCVFRSRTGFSLRLRGGPAFWIATGDRKDSETFILYSAQVWYDTGDLRFGGGFSGRYLASAEDGDFGERSTHQLTFALDFLLGTFRPGIQVRIPLDENYRDVLNVVIGVTLGIDLD